ncbi:hypothetical protein MTR_2g013480 [Medicago truncatula]|uniref:Uncharacterized protein n=1 Tax=Medicago truncatula TaxID=3880 RepID=G7IPS3_MEDTR|nr:hypothetical protein MTR_2g013480 [Medicago truncatula]
MGLLWNEVLPLMRESPTMIKQILEAKYEVNVEQKMLRDQKEKKGGFGLVKRLRGGAPMTKEGDKNENENFKVNKKMK